MKIGIDELKQLNEHTFNLNGNKITLSFNENENSIEITFNKEAKQEEDNKIEPNNSLTLELVKNENGTNSIQEVTDTTNTTKRTLNLNKDDFFRLLNAKPYSQSILKDIYPVLPEETIEYKEKLEKWAKKYNYFISDELI